MRDLQLMTHNVPAVVFYDPTSAEPIVTVELAVDSMPPPDWFLAVLRQALHGGREE